MAPGVKGEQKKDIEEEAQINYFFTSSPLYIQLDQLNVYKPE